VRVKKLMLAVIMVLFLFPGCSSAQKLSPEEQFKKSFPQHNYETFAKTPIKGIYEIYDGGQIIYYLPEGDFILAGNIYSKDRKNLTQESNAKKMVAKLANLPLDKALKIGNGKTSIVEFIDPNCHYCRLSFNFLKERIKDVTLHIFFHPLSEDSAKKIRHILCSKDKAQTYNDVLGGKLDANAQLNLCSDKAAEDMMKAHEEAAAKIGVRGTPLFYIKGQVIPGFDQPAIEKLLKE
jgi:thiol:disulfide interchange protein DsbC